jgi:hypothetical protein
MKNYYNVNYSALAVLLMPTLLRNDIEMSLLAALAKPLDLLGNSFSDHVKSPDAQIKAQTCYMQALLNNSFDVANGRIIVRTASIDYDYCLLWLESQNKPVMIKKEETGGFEPYLLSGDDRIGANNIDFEVALTSGLILDDAKLRQLRALVDRNKLASKKYRIVYE